MITFYLMNDEYSHVIFEIFRNIAIIEYILNMLSKGSINISHTSNIFLKTIEIFVFTFDIWGNFRFILNGGFCLWIFRKKSSFIPSWSTGDENLSHSCTRSHKDTEFSKFESCRIKIKNLI